MDTTLIGPLIREARQKLGMSQEKLCEDLCEPITILRIENGKTESSRRMLRALLQKLGLPERYLYFPSGPEQELDALTVEARAQSIAFEQAVGAERAARRERALGILQDLEEKAGKNDVLIRQFVMAERIDLGTETGPYSLPEQRELLLEAIRLTNSKFELEQMGSFRYTQTELELINQVAVTYALEEERERAIAIYRQLLTYMRENNQQLSYYVGQYTMVTTNLARELMMDAQYDEAISVVQQGREVSLKYGKFQCIPKLLALLANANAHLGNEEESKELYLRACCFYKELGDDENLAHLKKDAMDTLKFQLF